MDKYLKAMVSYYKEIVTDEMHWSRLHCVVEDGNMSDGDISSSINTGITTGELVICNFLLALPKDIRREIWERSWEV